MSKKQLIESLKSQGFASFIIEAFASVAREDFVPEKIKHYAYEDTALPIGEEQTISQPYTIAFMLSLLDLENIRNKKIKDIKDKKTKILEIGSGSGYVLALLSKICPKSEIYGVEIKKSLIERSRQILSLYKNIKIKNKSGFSGLPDFSPFDRILVSASAPNIETIENISLQLKNTGILVAPVRNSIFQIKRQNEKFEKKEFPGFIFVPLVEE